MYDILTWHNLRWVDHLNILENSRLPKQILSSQLREESHGSKLRYMDMIKRNLGGHEDSLRQLALLVQKLRIMEGKKSTGCRHRIWWTAASCRVCVLTNMCMDVRVCVYICVSLYMHIFECMGFYIYIYIYIYICVCVCAYICVCTCALDNSWSLLSVSNTLTVAPAERLDPSQKRGVLDMILNCIRWRSSSHDICGSWSTASLPLLPDSLWPRVVVPVRIPFLTQIRLKIICIGYEYLVPYN